MSSLKSLKISEGGESCGLYEVREKYAAVEEEAEGSRKADIIEQ